MIGSLSTAYSEETRDIIKSVHRIKENMSVISLNKYIDRMTKIDIMDVYIDWHKNRITSSIINEAIIQAFKFSLEPVPVLTTEKLDTFEIPLSTDIETPSIPPSKIILDLYLDHHNNAVTSAEVRKMINHFFGMNLVGIASLGKSRISLFSKNQWLVKNKLDLFVIHTGTRDVDVKIYTTGYFTKQTGLENIPIELQQSLTQIGFSYNEEVGNYYFSNPTGHTVSNEFKGKTIGAVIEVINKLYYHL